MRFVETALSGAYIVELEPVSDDRGFFARSFCQREFAAHGMKAEVVQCNVSFNKLCGTLRGMHYQIHPDEEAKLVRCTAGAVYDVIVDLRPDSATFMQWTAYELTAENHKALYVPEGFAHGFQTLQDNTEMFYQMYGFYAPESARGIRWNDPAFAIDWPLTIAAISDRDQEYPDFATGDA